MGSKPLIRTEMQFRQRKEEGAAKLLPVVQEVNELVRGILQLYNDIVNARARISVKDALSDIHTQLEHLVYRGFLGDIDLDELRHIPRYLSALRIRIDRLLREPAKDALKQKSMGSVWQRCRELLLQQRAQGIKNQELKTLRWMVEEFRVSLFAQELGTAYPVSAKRLDEQWSRVSKALSTLGRASAGSR
jgi:ATP-dependent helicase HrpA